MDCRTRRSRLLIGLGIAMGTVFLVAGIAHAQPSPVDPLIAKRFGPGMTIWSNRDAVGLAWAKAEWTRNDDDLRRLRAKIVQLFTDRQLDRRRATLLRRDRFVAKPSLLTAAEFGYCIELAAKEYLDRGERLVFTWSTEVKEAFWAVSTQAGDHSAEYNRLRYHLGNNADATYEFVRCGERLRKHFPFDTRLALTFALYISLLGTPTERHQGILIAERIQKSIPRDVAANRALAWIKVFDWEAAKTPELAAAARKAVADFFRVVPPNSIGKSDLAGYLRRLKFPNPPPV